MGPVSQDVKYFQFLNGEYDELLDQNSKETKKSSRRILARRQTKCYWK